MEISLLNRDQIDIAKWDARVELSSNGLPYGLSSYLDIVTHGNWEALVAEDYTYIFPLTFEFRFQLKFYNQPLLAQQLGIIGPKADTSITAQFIGKIPNSFAYLNIKGNELNHFDTEHFKQDFRVNLVLPLNQDYASIAMNFAKSLKKRIRQSKTKYQLSKVETVDQIVDFYHQEMESRLNLGAAKYAIIKKLLKFLVHNNLGFGIQALDEQGKPDAQLFLIQYKNRLINLFGASNQNGKEKFAMHFLLNSMIKQYANSEMLLDFEGSEIKGVQEFYQSFGAINRPYPELTANQLPGWYNILAAAKKFISK